MLRITSIVLIMIYTAVQGIGMSFNVHYCGDKITHINLLDIEADCCCEATANSPADNCCDDEQVYAKINNEHAAASSNISLRQAKLFSQFIKLAPHTTVVAPIANSHSQYNNSSPPLPLQKSWLFFCTLRL